jgi:hypothetical protein
MIKNLTHAFIGAVAFLGLGWLVIQPAQVAWMAHHKDVHYALAGALVVLALFVIVCLVRAVRPPKAAATRTTPYSATARRR